LGKKTYAAQPSSTQRVGSAGGKKEKTENKKCQGLRSKRRKWQVGGKAISKGRRGGETRRNKLAAESAKKRRENQNHLAGRENGQREEVIKGGAGGGRNPDVRRGPI